MFDCFKLFLFSVDEGLVRKATRASVDGIIVDWENIGKVGRQSSADTEINTHTGEDLRIVRSATDKTVICRVNNVPEVLEHDLEQAIALGADEVLLPMVRSRAEVEQVIDFVDGRCRVGILIETVPAVEISEQFSGLPLSRIYLGLNDLHLDSGSPHIFSAVADGTVEGVRNKVSQPFGFAGLTLPEKGNPVPCRLLMGEMSRLNCDFSFLRRSFHRDIAGCDLESELPRIKEKYIEMRARTLAQVIEDQRLLSQVVSGLSAGAAAASKGR